MRCDDELKSGYGQVMISELMRYSLFDVFKASEFAMPLRRSLRYAMHFAQGMNYLHTCKPPVRRRGLELEPGPIEHRLTIASSSPRVTSSSPHRHISITTLP